MTKQLYEEALADVKKLKEVAEDNAKRALLEAVTPRIRDLIENQLLGEMGVGEVDADPEDILKDEMPVTSADDVSRVPVAVSANVTPGLSTMSPDGCEDEYELSMEAAKSLGLLVTENKASTFEDKLRYLDEKVKLFEGASKIVKSSPGFTSSLSEVVSEVENTYSYLQTNLQDSPKMSSYESILENQYSTLKQLMEQKMKKKLGTLSEADVTLKLTGMPDELDLDSIGVDLITGEDEEGEGGEEEGGEDEFDLGGDEEGGEEGSEEEGGEDELDLGGDEESDNSEEKMESRRLSDDTIVEIDEGMLRREIARMKTLREENETKAQSWGHGPGDVSHDMDFEDEDLGDPFTDVDLTTEGDKEDEKDKNELDEIDEMSMEVDESYGEVDEMSMEVDELDEVEEMEHEGDMTHSKQGYMPESLRRRIASEMKIQLEAKKKAAKAKKKAKEQQAKEKQAKKPSNKTQAKKTQAKLKEAYNFYATKFNESVARTNKLKGMLAEATRKGAVLNGGTKKSAVETNLRNKLAETNLFNAKLLFTNKLLQNESLTKRQKAEVIERLDEAKNEREVKLVYESLVKTLAGSPAKITESADRGVIGSASRPARPAAATNTLNEGFEADRWARLAGIVK